LDLRTSYLGLSLKNPLVGSASPLWDSVDKIRRGEDAGLSAVVLFSLFEEQILHDANALEHLVAYGSNTSAEAMSYFPEVKEYRLGPDSYLELISKAKQAVKIPIIASLNGYTDQGWIDYAKDMAQAGADAIELNVYHVPADPALTGRDVEKKYLDVLKAVRSAVKIPVAIKLSPYFSSMANMAGELVKAGADGLVLFNRFYQPDFDIETLEVNPDINLSNPSEIRLALRWIAILRGKLSVSIAATSGVHSGTELVKYLLAGADVAMVTSTLLRYGIDHAARILRELEGWMERKEYAAVKQMRGAMSQKNVADPTAFERANYVKAMSRYKNPYANS